MLGFAVACRGFYRLQTFTFGRVFTLKVSGYPHAATCRTSFDAQLQDFGTNPKPSILEPQALNSNLGETAAVQNSRSLHAIADAAGSVVPGVRATGDSSRARMSPGTGGFSWETWAKQVEIRGWSLCV